MTANPDNTVNNWLDEHIKAAKALREVYYKAKRLKGVHASLGLDASMSEQDALPGPQTKAEIDAVITILDAMMAFIDTNDRLAALERLSRTV